MAGRSRNPGFVPGDYYIECPICSFEYRESQMRRRWDGQLTCIPDWEPRQPQDFVRGVKDVTAPQGLGPRPPTEVFATVEHSGSGEVDTTIPSATHGSDI
jgi:hypothetical protein